MTQTNVVTNYNHRIEYDGQISIATGKIKKETHWKNKTLLWSELVDKLSNTTRTPETVAEYKAMPKADKDRIKDVGGFVGGSLKNGRRKAENVANRTLLTLDLDYVQGDIWSSIELLYDFSVAMYSTHTHTPEEPRLRLVIPLSRPVLPDEYQAIGRMVAEDLGIDQFDDTTYEPSRLMYWGSTSSDGEYIFKVQDSQWLNPEDVLNRYIDWKDISYWPESSRARAKINKALKKQEDPLEKKGIIGAFCRTYSITEAIGEFLDDVYVPGADETRYTYAEGSTTGGVVIYEDKFSFSHHGTDPTSGVLCNAFDLVRINKFVELDENVKEDTPVNRLPSFTKMSEFASSDKKVKIQIGKEKMAATQKDFGVVVTEGDQDNIEWLNELTYTRGKVLDNTVKNYRLIIENEPLLKGKIAYDDFNFRKSVLGKLPWDDKFDVVRDWCDIDDSGLREFIESYYGNITQNKYNDSVALAFKNNSFHPVKDYFNELEWDGIKRIDTLLIDYFGAENTEYNKFVIRKWLVAAVARIYNPGCKFDYMLILCGPGGIGKSTFFKKLALEKWFTDSLKKYNEDKNVMETMVGKLIAEFGELASLKKVDVDVIKDFITRTEFNARLSYGREATRRLIQWVYCGTTNTKEFLKDKTGNRRFWPVDVNKKSHIKNVFNDLDNEVPQIWAEAITLYKNSEKIYLTKAEEKEAEKQQNAHMETDELEQIIEDKLNWSASEDTWQEYTFTEIVTSLNLSDRLRGYARQNLKTILAKSGINQNVKSNKRVYKIPPMNILRSIADLDVVENISTTTNKNN